MAEQKEHNEQKKSDVIEIPVGKYFEKVRKNPWMISTIVLAIVLIVVIFMKGGGSDEIVILSDQEVNQKVSDFVKAATQDPSEVEIVKVEKESSMYKATVNYKGQQVPVYMTLDGKYIIQQPLPLDSILAKSDSPQQEQPSVDVPKSDKPKVELFVMSFCPYGTQMEKGILPVVSALKDKIDFTLRYTHFTLHGEKEDTENFRQICIREEQKSKFLPYIQCTLNSTDPYAPANVTQCMKNLGINVANVDNCIKNKSKEYYAVDSQLSQGYGVQGSPTLIINGVQADSGRSPANILSAVCSSFNNAPVECSSSNLPTQSPSPGFGYSSSGSDAAAASCGV